MQGPQKPIELFCSYAHEDEAQLQKLETHLSMLKRQGLISTWYDWQITAGTEWAQAIDTHLNSASVILLLISPDFFASNYCYGTQMQRALERHKANEACVIPILLRPVDWHGAPFAHLQALPTHAKPVTIWSNHDEAWVSVALGIRRAIEDLAQLSASDAHHGKTRSEPQDAGNYHVEHHGTVQGPVIGDYATVHISTGPVYSSLSPSREEREQRLRLLFIDHSNFLCDRLSSFVGRQSELADISQRLQEKRLTGGYVTITGQAGQGKSSIIAQLVHNAGPEQVAYHFIPFNPGLDHQVSVLRNLMARLILKYDLSDLYVASDRRAALRDYFPKVLAEVAAKGGQETIFIDGLDQLEEDWNGLRDLSFLPNDPPASIVFVLGTRPDDTLRPLELLKPLDEYRLPNLSRQDFDLILHQRQVALEPMLADQFYRAMQQNALYLDLVAKELGELGLTSPQDLIARIADNPSNLFSLSIDRLKRQPLEWREVLKPILRLLLVAREPLGLRHIRSILKLEDDRLRDGIRRLGGLLADTGQQRYTLFHLKLRDYLRQNERIPQKEYIFATDEEERWHTILADWCEQGSLERIWEDVKEQGEQERRVYARKHVIAHLYFAHQWQRLFDILDEGSYGRVKERYDVSTRSYIQDLDFGRRAAAWSDWSREEGLTYLPQLWRYTLLRCSLRSRADQYPSGLFSLLLLLGREQEALGHAELLTDPARKATILQDIAEHLTKQPRRQGESEQLSLRAYEVACSISESDKRARTLSTLASSLAKTQCWEQAKRLWVQAEEAARSISESYEQAWALKELACSLVQVQRWEQAEKVARSITEDSLQAWALRELAYSLAEAQCWKQAEEVSRSLPESDDQAIALSVLASSLAKAQRREQAERLWIQAEEAAHSISESHKQAWALRELANSLVKAQRREQAERLWIQAEEVARSISESVLQAGMLGELASSWAKAQRKEQAERLWIQAEEVARSAIHSYPQALALRKLVSLLAEAQCWKQAEEIACSITHSDLQAGALSDLGIALVEKQQWEYAESICTKAEEVAHSIAQNHEQTIALSTLASSLAEAQRWEQAEEIARSISESYIQAWTLRDLASLLAEAQCWEQAEEIAHSITQSDLQTEALSMLASSLAQAQCWEQAKHLWTQAEEVARSITEDHKQATALKELASSLAKAQCWERAEEIARSITQSDLQTEALSMLASSLVKAQCWERAEEIARSITQSDLQTEALSVLASSLAQAQRWEQAEEVSHSLSENDDQVITLSVLASSLAEAQDWKRAEYFWTQAEEIARSIPESYRQAMALKVLASSLAEAQRWKWAERLWNQIEEIARSIPESYRQAKALEELASSLAQVQYWEQAGEVAHSISESEMRATALSVLVSSLVQAQRWELAEEVARSIPESYEQAKVLEELVSSLVQAQRWEQAKEVTSSIPERYEQAMALKVLASSLVQAQRWEQAEHFWNQAEEVALSIIHSDMRARVLRELVEVLLKHGDYERVFSLVQRSWLQAETRAFTLELFSLALGLIPLKPEIGVAFHEAFKWVDMFLGGRHVKLHKDKILSSR